MERLFGYAPRVTHDKLRVAEALQRLPEISDQLSEGELSYSHARELTRVATPETENKWLEAARGRTVREVEKLVSGRAPGALPSSPPEPRRERHVLRFEVSGETLASFREMATHLRREAGEHLDDDALLLMLARRVLGGPTDDGRASYQIALDVCEQCQRARQVADGDAFEVSRAAAEMARCEAQHVPSAHVGGSVKTAPTRAAQDVGGHLVSAPRLLSPFRAASVISARGDTSSEQPRLGLRNVTIEDRATRCVESSGRASES